MKSINSTKPSRKNIMAKRSNKRSKTEKGKSSLRILIPLIIIALALFTIIVMAINSRKPDRLVLENIDSKVKGSYFIKTNQALLDQMIDIRRYDLSHPRQHLHDRLLSISFLCSLILRRASSRTSLRSSPRDL